MMYMKYPLSHRKVEDLLSDRGMDRREVLQGRQKAIARWCYWAIARGAHDIPAIISQLERAQEPVAV